MKAIHFLAWNEKRHGGDLQQRFLDEFNSLRAANADESLWKVHCCILTVLFF